MDVINGSGSGTRDVFVYWANEDGWHDENDGDVKRSLPYPYPWGTASTVFASAQLKKSTDPIVTVDVTPLVDYWTTWSIPQDQAKFHFKGEEPENSYSLKVFTLSLAVTYNGVPSPSPSIASSGNPVDGAVWSSNPMYLLGGTQVSDGEGATVRYRAEIAEDSGFSRLVSTGDSFLWSDGAYGTAIAGAVYLSPKQIRVLEPGRSYFWRIAATDGTYWVYSGSQSFMWDPDPVESPMDTVGPLTTNLATGGVTTAVSSPSFAALGGPVGAAFVYNSHDLGDYGLSYTAWIDSDGDAVVDPGELVAEAGIERAASFDWGSGGPTSNTSDYFTTKWSGTIDVPSDGNTYQLGLSCDDNARVTIAGTVRINRWTSPACSAVTSVGGYWVSGAVDWATIDGTTSGGAWSLSAGKSPITIEMKEIAGGAMFRLWVRKNGGMWDEVPASWFTPATIPALPPGWRLSVGAAAASYVRAYVVNDALVLVAGDGTRVTWTRSDGSSSTVMWIPEDGVEASATLTPSGQIVVTDGGFDYLFDTAGNLARVAASADDEQTSTAIEVTYDAGRPTAATDPVTGRILDLQYQTTGGNANCPSAPSWLPSGEQMAPAGFLCAVRFKASSGATPELWTTVTYYTTSGNLARVINFPDLTSTGNSNLDANETTQFGYDTSMSALGSPINQVRASSTRRGRCHQRRRPRSLYDPARSAFTNARKCRRAATSSGVPRSPEMYLRIESADTPTSRTSSSSPSISRTAPHSVCGTGLCSVSSITSSIMVPSWVYVAPGPIRISTPRPSFAVSNASMAERTICASTFPSNICLGVCFPSVTNPIAASRICIRFTIGAQFAMTPSNSGPSFSRATFCPGVDRVVVIHRSITKCDPTASRHRSGPLPSAHARGKEQVRRAPPVRTKNHGCCGFELDQHRVPVEFAEAVQSPDAASRRGLSLSDITSRSTAGCHAVARSRSPLCPAVSAPAAELPSRR